MTGAHTGPIFGLVGHGVTGGRVATHLLSHRARVAVHDPAPSFGSRSHAIVRVDNTTDLTACDLVVLCSPGPHQALAERFLSAGTPVVTVSDGLDDLKALLLLQSVAERNGAAMIIGAGISPGLSGLLAAYLARQVYAIDELHVATHGTAGPACARQHHEALGDTALGWHDGEWIEPPGGSGRDLVWFPEPIGAHDCYRAALGDPLLLHRAFPAAQRISARISATRRDRLTARLPMLTPPHPSGDLGSVRVEARGANEHGERIAVIAGATGPTADLASAVCAAAALQMVQHPLPAGVHVLGSPALDHLDLLHHATTMGVRVQEFTGVARPTSW